MFCESRRQALINAAASAEPLEPALAAHVATCASCFTALAEERQLFGRVDESLHAIANAHAPQWMVQRIQAAIFQDQSVRRPIPWQKWALLPASAGLGMLSLALFFHQNSPNEQAASNATATLQTSRPSPEHQHMPSSEVISNSGPPPTTQHRRSHTFRAAFYSDEPRVKVDPDARPAMQQLLAFSRSDPEIAQSFSIKPDPAALEIEPIEVASIHLDPLFPKDQAKDQAEPNR